MPETPVSEMAVYTARPTIEIDTQQYPRVSELLRGMRMTETEGGLSALEMRLSNFASDPQGGADLAFEDDAILKLGASINVYAGDETAPTEIFRGKITGLEIIFPDMSAPELVVLAEDALQAARMARRSATYDAMTISDLADQIASNLGLTPVVTAFTDDIGTHVQMDESDLAFLRRVVARYDGDVQVVGTELHVSPRGDVQRGEVTLELGSQLRSARVLADLSHQVTEVTVSGWDVAQGQRISATSTGAQAGPGAGRTGADVLRDTLGERSEHISHLAVRDQAEAQAAADAAFDLRARRFLYLEGTAEGNPALRVGTHATISGMGSRFDNVYYVVRACHRFDTDEGYKTDFEAECAYWGGA